MKWILIAFMIWYAIHATSTDKAIRLVDPDSIAAISFPADVITLHVALRGDGKLPLYETIPTPNDLHVICGWWDRPDSSSTNRLVGSCAHVGANYSDERNMTCYANTDRLLIDTTRVVCATDTEGRMPLSYGLPYVVQDSCKLTIGGSLTAEEPMRQWNPKKPTRRSATSEPYLYGRVMERYENFLRDQIDTEFRFNELPSGCRFNKTHARLAIANALHDSTEWVCSIPSQLFSLGRRWQEARMHRPALETVWRDLINTSDGSDEQCAASFRISAFVMGVAFDIAMLVMVISLPIVLYHLISWIKRAMQHVRTKHAAFLEVSSGLIAVVVVLVGVPVFCQLIELYTDRIPPR